MAGRGFALHRSISLSLDGRVLDASGHACWDVLGSGGEVLPSIDSEMIRGDSLDPTKSAGQSGVSRKILGSLPCSSKVGPK